MRRFAHERIALEAKKPLAVPESKDSENIQRMRRESATLH
jgi:hypothetical protein